MQDQYVMDIVGALEYDPELKSPQPHRQFLNTSVAFKEVRCCTVLHNGTHCLCDTHYVMKGCARLCYFLNINQRGCQGQVRCCIPGAVLSRTGAVLHCASRRNTCSTQAACFTMMCTHVRIVDGCVACWPFYMRLAFRRLD
eukprot:1161729-Pelagomonas_calceolata.AAC.13